MRFNTQPPEGGWQPTLFHADRRNVSTHSRLKAAGHKADLALLAEHGFNTQPPEGGWPTVSVFHGGGAMFQHTAA